MEECFGFIQGILFKYDGQVTTNDKKSAEVEVAFPRVGCGEGPNNL